MVSLPNLNLSDILVVPFANIIDAQKKITHENLKTFNSMFDENGVAHIASFNSKRNGKNKQINIPVVSMVNVPSLNIDSVEVKFDVNVSQATESINEYGESSTSITGSLTNQSNNTFSTNLSITMIADNDKPNGIKILEDMLANNIHITTEKKNNDELIIVSRMKI